MTRYLFAILLGNLSITAPRASQDIARENSNGRPTAMDSGEPALKELSRLLAHFHQSRPETPSGVIRKSLSFSRDPRVLKALGAIVMGDELSLLLLEELRLSTYGPAVSFRFLDSPSGGVRSMGLRLLIARPEIRAFDRFAKLVADPDPTVREELTTALWVRRDPESVPILRKLSRDPAKYVRRGVFYGLAYCQGIEPEDYSLAFADPVPMVRATAVDTVTWLPPAQARACLPKGKALLGDVDSEVRFAALRAVSYLSRKEGRRAAATKLDDPSLEVRTEARRILRLKSSNIVNSASKTSSERTFSKSTPYHSPPNGADRGWGDLVLPSLNIREAG